MPRTSLALRTRSLASRATLASGFLVLLATSAPPRWAVEDHVETELPELSAGDRLHRVAVMRLHLTTPSGTWPLHISSSGLPLTAVWFEGKETRVGPARISWDSNCADIDCTAPRSDFSVDQSETMCEARVAACEQPQLEVHCDSGPCVLDYEVEVHARAHSAYVDDKMLGLGASFAGSLQPDGAGCQDKDSSTDSESAPAGLTLSIRMGRFEADESDPSVAPDDAPYYPHEPPFMLDGGPRDGSAAADADLADASMADGSASDAGLADASVTDASGPDHADANAPSEGGR